MGHIDLCTPLVANPSGPGSFVPDFEKQKIKMPKMAAVAAVFDILIFCFSRILTRRPPLLAWLQVGQRDGSRKWALATTGN